MFPMCFLSKNFFRTLALWLALGGIALAEGNTAIQPTPRDNAWLKRHESFVELAKAGGIDVLFLGDSITDFWRDPKRGKTLWDEHFAPLHAANFGISADRTQHVLWRMDHGELDGIKPKVVVLMIGTNNTGLERDKVTPRNTVPEAIAGVTAVVTELREKLPETKILLLAIFPRGEKDSPQRAQVAEINAAIAKLDDGKFVHFLDIGPKFLWPDGTLSSDIMPDLLHPSEIGYAIWAAAIKQPLEELLK
jgi:lysophospholipase L1-like esterase